MEIKKIFEKVSASNYLLVEEADLKLILDSCDIIRTEDTHLSDLIRLVKFEDKLFIQETTFKKEILIRKINSMEEADHFIQERLDYYERKWDGCGCKIDYYE